MLIQELINTGVQLAVVLFIALIVWLLAFRRRGNFFTFNGLILPNKRSMIFAIITAIIIIPLTLMVFHLTGVTEGAAADNTVAGNLREHGFSTEVIFVILLVAIIKTGLTEEILFRGVLAKRLIRWLGFSVGNFIHAAIFAAVHLLIFILPGGPEFTLVGATVFFGAPFVGAWIKAYLNEQIGNGSIAPGWFIHGLTNAISYPVIAFL